MLDVPMLLERSAQKLDPLRTVARPRKRNPKILPVWPMKLLAVD
jgi:hypothetical protein